MPVIGQLLSLGAKVHCGIDVAIPHWQGACHILPAGGVCVGPMLGFFLVLLLSILQATPWHQLGLPGPALPATRCPQPLPETPHAITLSLLVDGQLFVDERWIPAEHFEPELRRTLALQPEAIVRIQAHLDLPYHHVRRLLEVCQSAGIRRVTLVTLRQLSGPGASAADTCRSAPQPELHHILL
jgi:biopolymer transport protein ExbD